MLSLIKYYVKGSDAKVIDKVPPIILQSWQRCRSLSVNHERIIKDGLLQQDTLTELLDINEAFVLAARPILVEIFNFLKSKNYILLLSNRDGIILETFGDPPFINKAKKIHLTRGANWQEKLKGTNGIGTVLIEKTPLAIPGWTHYAMPVNFLDCWASPIRSADGEVLGVLNISGEAGAKHEHLMEITTVGANMIEHSMQLSEIKQRFNFCREKLDDISKLIFNNQMNIGANGLIKQFNGDKVGNMRREEIIGKTIDEVFEGQNSYLVTHSFNSDDHKCAGGQKAWYGRSLKTRAVFDLASRAAKGDTTVLIQGESGTGKEIVAQTIHNSSLRKDKPFVTLNCAAIPDNLVESELFGYVDGAFTGAKKGGQPGKFELANGGTIFLDEIGDMPFNVQATMLRVLQQKEICRIGEGKCREIDVRIIAATNQDLRQLVDQGKFRLDLYYRLMVILISIPPLRERIEDLEELVPFFVQKFCTKLGLSMLDVSPELHQYFVTYPWPGNIRQLENCIESLVALSNGGTTLTPDDLPPEYRSHLDGFNANLSKTLSSTLSSRAEGLERMTIVRAINDSDGNLADAARKLGIGRTTLYRKLDKLLIPH